MLDLKAERGVTKRKRVWKLRGKARKRPTASSERGKKKLTINGSLSNLEIVERLWAMGSTVDECPDFSICLSQVLTRGFVSIRH